MSRNGAGWPPSEGTSGFSDVPFSPWQARQGASRSASGWPLAGAANPQTSARAMPAKTLAGTADARAPVVRRGSAAIGHAVDRAVVVVGDEERAVLHDLDVDRTRHVAVVLDEAGEEGLD